MFGSRMIVVGVALAVGAVGAVQALQDAWPPAPIRDAVGADPLSAEESMQTIVVPPGYRVELVASEPLVIDPILMDFDQDGRMWVLEMPAFAHNRAMEDSREPVCRVVVLEDTDGDGQMDKRTVAADGLVLPRALKVVSDGVLVGEPPMLWLMKDTDGDLVIDVKEQVADTYGARERNIEHNANSLIWGLDNWIYTSEHDWHLRWVDGGYQIMPTLSRGQWGGAIDDAGRVYRNVNSSPLFVDFTLARYFQRNPNQVRTSGLYESLIGLEDAVIWPIRPTRGVNRGYRDQFFREDDTSWIIQSGGTPLVYRGRSLPEELQGAVLVTDSTTNLVHHFTLVDDGTGRVVAKNGFDRGEIFASTDERLRPVSLAAGWDGALYIVDMYRGVTQDVAYQTDYLMDYISRNELATPVNMGRIWRLVHDDYELDSRPSMSDDTPAELVAHLSHPNGWWRDMAQMLLVQRGDASVVPAVTELARRAPDWRTKLHAMGVLAGLSALDVDTVRMALGDENPDVRAWGLRWSEPWLSEAGHPLAADVIGLVDDPNWVVRRQVAATLGELPGPARIDPAVEMLRLYGDDEMTVDAMLSSLAGLEATVLERLAQSAGSPDRTEAVSMLAATIARGGDVAAVGNVVAMATDTARPEWQRLALLEGLDLGLPGGGGGRGGRGGGRGGFGGRGGGAPARVTLPAEPAALILLAGGTGPLAGPAAAAAAKLDWPGKPAPPPPTAAPLTEEDMASYAVGETVYASLCIGCHQADGRGLENVAKSIVGSPYVTSNNAGNAIRILLNGKEGEVGLMPPLGTTLTDEQIAGVLTYIRQQWGHTAPPVDWEDVREIRGLTSIRTTPYSDADFQ